MDNIFAIAIKSINMLYFDTLKVSNMIIPRDITGKRRLSQILPLLAMKSLEKYELT